MIQKHSQQTPSCPHLKPLASFKEDHKKPEFIVHHLKTQNMENDDRQPYEECKQLPNQNSQFTNKNTLRQNISLSIALAQQNQELAHKIEMISRQIEDESLKAQIFQDKIQKNEKEIMQLRSKKDELLQSQRTSLRMETLNQSHIPNKSAEMSATINNNLWMNEFMNKQQLQNLWSTKRQANTSKVTKVEPKVKCFTIDLSSHMKQKKEKEKVQSKLSCSSVNPKQTKVRSQKTDKNKKTIVSVAHNAKSLTGRVDLKLNLQQKSVVYNEPVEKNKALNKAISTLRNAKKLKPNPQL